MIFKKSATLTTKLTKANAVTTYIKEQLEAIPAKQGLKMTDLVSDVVAKFGTTNKRNIYVKLNHILKNDASYHRYTENKKRNAKIYIGKIDP